MSRHMMRTMMSDRRSTLRNCVMLLALLVAVGACTGFRNYREAQLAEEQGDWDQAVLQYLALLDRDPGNLTYRSGLLRAKFKASQAHFEKAKQFHEAGALERAMLEYQQAVQLDPTNQYAQVELDKVRIELSSARQGDGLLTLEDLKRRTQESRPQPPMLSPREKDPISLNFPKPVSVKDIYDAIAKAFGINILFDAKLRDQQLTIELSEVMAGDALEMLMRSANHFYKVLDEHSHHRRRGQPAEPPGLRGSGDPDLLSLQRRPEGEHDAAAQPGRGQEHRLRTSSSTPSCCATPPTR